ncbi:MAG TPA: ABC transporter permease [Bacillota bacterium]|nr:ABC transporter permease [Bacillota bacterium]
MTSNATSKGFTIAGKQLPRQFGPLLGLVLLCVLIAFMSPVFLTLDNLMNIILQVAVIVVMAVGSTYVIITGGIDLSVGSIMGLVGVITAITLHGTNSTLLGILVSLGLGAFIGLVNGLLITIGKVPPFCATLGMMAIGRGLAFVITKGCPISNFSDQFRFFGAGYLGPIPIPVIEAVIVALVGGYILSHTPLGRYIFAVGSNLRATRLSGVNTKLIVTLTYLISGLLCGLAAILFIGRINSGHPLAGQGYEMDAIAAVVIGGTSLAGGTGSISGTFIGALIMGVIRNGLNLINVDPFWQNVVLGAVIIIAVLVDQRTKGKEE